MIKGKIYQLKVPDMIHSIVPIFYSNLYGWFL